MLLNECKRLLKYINQYKLVESTPNHSFQLLFPTVYHHLQTHAISLDGVPQFSFEDTEDTLSTLSTPQLVDAFSTIQALLSDPLIGLYLPAPQWYNPLQAFHALHRQPNEPDHSFFDRQASTGVNPDTMKVSTSVFWKHLFDQCPTNDNFSNLQLNDNRVDNLVSLIHFVDVLVCAFIMHYNSKRSLSYGPQKRTYSYSCGMTDRTMITSNTLLVTPPKQPRKHANFRRSMIFEPLPPLRVPHECCRRLVFD